MVKKFIASAMIVAGCLASLAPANARPLDIIEDGKVIRIEYAGTCDEAYDEYRGRVYACVSLQTRGGDNVTETCSGPGCEDLVARSVGQQSVRASAASTPMRPVTMRPVTEGRVVSATPRDAARMSVANTSRSEFRLQGWDICNGTYCRSVQKCNEAGTRYKAKNGSWHDMPTGYACYKNVLVPIGASLNARGPARK